MHRWQIIGVAAGLSALALWLRWPTFGFSLWNLDEAIHATVARTLLDGGVLYRDAIDQRTPLSYYAVAGIFSIFGENNLWAVRCSVALLVAATGGLLFLAGRNLRGATAGFAAGASYVLFATGVLFQGDANAANTEWFVAFFTSAAAVVFLHGGSSPSARRMFAVGALLAAAFLSKQPALLDAAAPCAALVYLAWGEPRRWREVAARFGALAAGWLTPVAAMAVYFAAQGALSDALFYTWTYNLAYYGPEITTTERMAAALIPLRVLTGSQPIVFVGWVAGAALVIHRLLQRQPTATERVTNPALAFLACWSLTAFGGSVAGGRDFQHYAIQFLAPFCLGAGLSLAWVAERIRSGQTPVFWRVAGTLVLGLATYQAVSAAVNARHRSMPEDASLRVSHYIRDHSAPAAKIFVWGYHPDIYLLSDRRAASRFIYASFLTGLVPWTNGAPEKDTSYAIVPGAMDQLLRDLARSQPEFIVDCSAGPNRFWPKYPLDKFPALNAFVRQHYRLTEPHQFVPQGFRLFQRRPPGDTASEDLDVDLPVAFARTFTLGTLAAPLPPQRVSAVHGADLTMVDGRLQYFVHAPSTITYRLPAETAFLRGGVGFRPGAYAPENSGPTDGAEFIVRWRPDGGAEQILFRRLLRPREESADRGVHAFRVALPPHQGGELELVITRGPNDNSASDWTFWSDLMLEKAR